MRWNFFYTYSGPSNASITSAINAFNIGIALHSIVLSQHRLLSFNLKLRLNKYLKIRDFVKCNGWSQSAPFRSSSHTFPLSTKSRTNILLFGIRAQEVEIFTLNCALCSVHQCKMCRKLAFSIPRYDQIRFVQTLWNTHTHSHTRSMSLLEVETSHSLPHSATVCFNQRCMNSSIRESHFCGLTLSNQDTQALFAWYLRSNSKE